VRSSSISASGRGRPHRSASGCCTGYPGNLLDLELGLERAGAELIAGIDEAGRGPLAGPVVAAAVILRRDAIPEGIRDSKTLAPQRRTDVCRAIEASALSIGIGIVSPEAIDRFDILKATLWAMAEAVESLGRQPDCAIVDGNALPDLGMPAVAVVGGDTRCLSVAAASVIAKVTRDRLMESLDRLYPRYAFVYNKGYGTRAHIEALRRYGPSRVHRLSFEPVLRTLGNGWCEPASAGSAV
jgi:ribonuclease HII